jgi:Uma2 family endonuclease
MALPQTQLIDADEFEQFIARPENRDRNFELIDGVIVEKTMPTEEHAHIVGLITYLLAGYALAHGLGIPGPESRIRLPEHLRNVRQPDLSMVLDGSRPLIKRGPSLTMPDVIVEVKSPDDGYEMMREKARFYVENGAKLVWLVFPRPKAVEVYRPDQPLDILGVEDMLDGYDVLPGFSQPVRSLFPETHGG